MTENNNTNREKALVEKVKSANQQFLEANGNSTIDVLI